MPKAKKAKMPAVDSAAANPAADADSADVVLDVPDLIYAGSEAP